MGRSKVARSPGHPHGSPGEVSEVVRVKLLGGFRVSVGSRSIEEGEWGLRKAKSLVKLLAFTPGHRRHRDWIIEVLWPHLDPDAAANNLRRTLHAARRALDPDPTSIDRYLSFRGEQIALCLGSPVWVDIEAFENAAATARRVQDPAAYQATLDLYAGDLVPEDRYEDWTEERRAELRSLYLALLIELAGLYEERGEFGLAVEALDSVAKCEPLHEEAYAGPMRLHSLSDRWEEALLDRYGQLQETLSRKLGAEPGTATRRLPDEKVEAGFPEIHPAGRPEEPPDLTQHNLPAPRTSFVGREREMLDVKRELAMTRLLTLTGAGGSGKTCLALEVARDLVGAYPDGVWLVELAGLSEGELVPQAVAEVLAVREQPHQPLTDALVDALRDKEMLLVLDNCEHLVGACAGLMNSLLNSCPRVRVLATSREVLGVTGEVNLLVPPLSSPDLCGSISWSELERYESARLFLERARQRDPNFALTSQNARAVAEVCSNLEGIPLAIELAAARMGVLTVQRIAQRLGCSLGLLTTGVRMATARHRTLRGTLDWSHELLSEEERILFRRLSAFMGGCTFEAAEAVGADEDIEEGNVLDVLSELVNKSLVVVERAREGEVRYRLLEPIRQYAREKLEENGEAEAALRRHAAFFLAFAEEAEPELMRERQGEWLERLETEHENLRAALSWALHREEQLGLRLGAALWWFWYARGHLTEGRRWLEGCLSISSPQVSEARARTLEGAGFIDVFQGEFEDAKAFLEEALALFRELKVEEGVAASLTYLSCVGVLGERDDVPVQALVEEAMELRPKIKDPRTLGTLLLLSGMVAALGGDLPRSEALHEEALALFRKTGDVTSICHCLNTWGLVTLSGRAYEKASALFRENLHIARESDHKVTIQSSLVGLAGVATSQGQPARAVRLWGAAEVLEEHFGIRMTPAGLSLAGYEGYLALARSRLDEKQFAESWTEGKAMAHEEAIEYALGAIELFPAAPGPERVSVGEPPNKLTRREQEIVDLISRGYTTDRQISDELFISERTVETHVRNILKKLGLGSRAQVAAWVAERRLLDDAGQCRPVPSFPLCRKCASFLRVFT